MARNKFPTVSILMPTLNAEKFLGLCLESIKNQHYIKGKIEVIIADGGSTDNTLQIAKKYGAKIFKNPLRTAESGKAVALRQARGELVALIDSDNILPSTDWLIKMVEPFQENKEIIGSEPWKFIHRTKDGFIDRYCAMMGMNDPICYFLGNYDRMNVLSGSWTGLKVREKDKGEWVEVVFDNPQTIPTIGANGAVFRREVLMENNFNSDYLFDIDQLICLSRKKPILFAKVKVGIIHLFCGSDIKKFIKKQKRRIKDYLFFQKTGGRYYPWQNQNIWGITKFVFSCLTLFPLFWQTLKGYLKSKDPAWFFHPLACWITLIVYSQNKIASLFFVRELDRKGWKQ